MVKTSRSSGGRTARKTFSVKVKKTGFSSNIIAKNSTEAKKEFVRISKKERIVRGIVPIKSLSAKQIKPFKLRKIKREKSLSKHFI